MAGDATESQAPERPKSSWLVWTVAALIVLVLVSISIWKGLGPSGPPTTAQTQEEAEKKKQEELEKQKQSDPKIERLMMMPGEPEGQQFVKPGHWVGTSQRMKAIYQDFVGQSQVVISNGRNDMYTVDRTPFELEATRPVQLTKGRPKDIECTILAPQVDKAMQVTTTLADRGFGPTMRANLAVTPMPTYQYYFVILAKEPNRYGFVKQLDSVVVPFDGESDADDTEDPVHYHVVPLDIQHDIALPDDGLVWSSIAYVLWDEVDPKLLTEEQQTALVDWIHWGGQLVVNGPDSLDELKGSFLEPILPATSGATLKFNADDPALAELNAGWTIPAHGSAERLAATAPWSGVKFDLRPGGRAIDSTGGLFAERAVGRGRVVVSAIQLAERDLVNWRRGYQSFFNSGIMRRPEREYRKGFFGKVTLAWADKSLAERRLDARLVTNLRYMSRDLGTDTAYHFVNATDEPGSQFQRYPGSDAEPVRQYRPPALIGGIGAWNDFSATANAAREALVDAAGVQVPGTSFVVLCLAGYLIVLVPLNWLVFHALGRIEWAWVAAPIIAIVGTMVIVDRARLDIGFVRAQTEIGLLELQPEYPRGMLTRYTALYTSLSTTYDVTFDRANALAAPFPTSENPDLRNVPRSKCEFQRYDKSRLTGVFVPSNTTNMVHSEEMFSLDGLIRLGASAVQNNPQIENRSQVRLTSVAVVERSTRDEEQKAGHATFKGTWIGELRPGDSAPIGMARISVGEGQVLFAKERTDEASLLSAPRLNLEPMFHLALETESFEPGERRLVGRVDEVLPGESIAPVASQVRGATLVVAHLDFGPLPKPKRDLNTSQDVVQD